MRLKDKVAVVTGGGAGIGRETSLLFAREGAHVVVVDREAGDAEAVVAAIAAENGPEALAIRAEMSSEDDIKAMARTADERFGRIDVLVNNAGARVYGPVTEATPEDWELIVAVNLRAPGLCCQHVIPIMARGGGGSIVNLSSANAVAGRPNMALYDATKAGVLALTRSMACDHAEQNIRVNAVLPGPTLTDFHMKRAKEQGRTIDPAVTQRNPNGPGIMKRQGLPIEIAYANLFLACSESSFCTGGQFYIDGGMCALGQRS